MKAEVMKADEEDPFAPRVSSMLTIKTMSFPEPSSTTSSLAPAVFAFHLLTAS